MNLAFIGFLIISAVFAVYAYTFYGLTGKKLPAFLKEYAFAYYCLAAAFLLWAIAAVHPSFLETSVLFGDALLVLGSICLLSVLFHMHRTSRTAGIITGFIVGIFLLYARAYYFPPMPILINGLVFFNTQTPVVAVLGGIFFLIWLPANLMVARRVTLFLGVDGMSFVYSFIYILSTISAVLFIGSKTPETLIGTFILLGLCFIMLLYSNYILSKMLPSVSDIGPIPHKTDTSK